MRVRGEKGLVVFGGVAAAAAGHGAEGPGETGHGVFGWWWGRELPVEVEVGGGGVAPVASREGRERGLSA